MIDSDSDTDLLANNPFTSTSISVKGPNTKNISLSFHNNALTSTMNMSRNIEWPRSTQSIYDQRSVNNRRNMSPMSIRSDHVFQGRNMNNSHHAHGLSLQRPMFNGRGSSPMSLRSSASNVSALDIATAIKSNQYSKTDMKIILSACQKFMKHQTRKRIEKRRKLNVFLKRARRRSSSERELSDSSISSDDGKSTRTSIYKDNMSSCRSTRTDISKIRRTLQETNMYNDCSANFKQNSFRTMFSLASSNTNNNSHCQSQSLHSSKPLKDRFRGGFLLPSQRFNNSVASTTIPEHVGNIQNNDKVEKQCGNTKTNGVVNNVRLSSESDNEEIFSETVKENCLKQQQKQSHNENDITLPDKKRKKISPTKKLPIANGHVQRNNRPSNSSDETDDMIFIKPAVPVRKITKKAPEKLLATSQPFKKPVEIKQNTCRSPQQSQINEDKATKTNHESSENHPTNEVSMRPSFIKRKLFSQNLDIGENKAGIDDPMNSPQTVYSAIQKEKNKARKLVTTQSCLSREVHEGSNMLDLIHKIIPPDRLNVTVQTNKSKPDINAAKNKPDLEDKWDVTSIISTCNNDNMSDTYTDDETFEEGKNDSTKYAKTSSSKSKFSPQCKILIEKLNPANKNIKERISSKKTEETHSNNVKMANTKSPCHTGSESDFENIKPVRNNNNNSIKRIYKKDTLVPNKDPSHLTELNPIKRRNVTLETTLDNTTASVNKFNSISFRIRSHRAPKRKKCCQPEDTKNTCEPQNKNKKSRQDDECQSDIFTKHSDRDKEVKNNTKRKCQTPKKIKEKLDLKPVQKPLKTSTEIIKDIKSSNVDSSSVIKENDSKIKAKANNKTNSKRTCRTPKQSKEKAVTVPKKSKLNNEETDSSNKSRHIDLQIPVTNKKEDKSKLKTNGSNAKQSSQTSRRKKQQTDHESDHAKLDHSLDTSRNLRSRQINISISSNKENDASTIPKKGKRNKNLVQKDSFERNDNSKLDNTISNFDDSCRSLRSRKIDLSNSLINEKLPIKSRLINKIQSKIINKNVEVNSRKSDVSFSLLPNKKTLAKYKRG